MPLKVTALNRCIVKDGRWNIDELVSRMSQAFVPDPKGMSDLRFLLGPRFQKPNRC